MLDFIIDILEEVFDWGTETISEVNWTDVAETAINTGLLVATVITVTEISQDTIKREIRTRPELKDKGIMSVLIEDIKEKEGDTVVYLSAVNRQGDTVGALQMQGKSCRGLKKGDRVYTQSRI